jgi:hypothetical protein
MSLSVKFDGRHVIASTCPDTKFYSESAFWFALKKELNANHNHQGEGFDLVKKVMSRDGHMVGGDSYPYYLRDRKGRYCIHDAAYALRDVAVEINTIGSVHVTMESLE